MFEKIARNPVLVIVGTSTVATALVAELGTEAPRWFSLVAVGLGSLAALVSRDRVTPISDPRNDDGVPLVPIRLDPVAEAALDDE